MFQDAQTKKEEIQKNRGTLKVAILKGEERLPGLVALSLYDSKPFYFMTNAWSELKWTKKSRKVWSKQHKKKVDVPFYRLNVLDYHNFNMNNVDIADQLKSQYRWDNWMRKRKWWMSIFFWAMQVLVTNAYICY